MNTIKSFIKHCNCYLQGECVAAGQIWQPYIGQAVGVELESMVLTGGVEGQVALKWVNSMLLTKRGDEKIVLEHMVRTGGDKRSFGDNINHERVST